jgi:hypothetical protein
VKLIGALIAIAAMTMIAGCGTSISVNYDYDVNANFEEYRTYDWVPLPEAAPGSAKRAQQSNDLLDKRIKSNVDAVLSERGLSVNSSSPDMLVVYHVGVQDKVQVTDWGYRYSDYYWGWGGRDIDVYNYEEGTLIIDFIDAQTKELVWRGAGSVALDSSTSPEKSDELVRKVVGKIMSRYPPKR